MPAIPQNIHPDYAEAVAKDKLALDFALAVDGMFSITGFAHVSKRKGRYVSLFCKPTKAISDALLINREVLAVLTTYEDLDPRTVSVIKDIIAERNPQLATEIAIVLHSDPQGDTKLRQWGKEQAIKVVPVFRPKATAQPPEVSLRQQLTANLLAVDPFQVTGPVSDDGDFFGRRNDALDCLRLLEGGRIRSLFGIRKVGKTSFINRVVALARAKGSPRVAMIDCSLALFNQLDAASALGAIARVAGLASHHGYAHISDAAPRSGANELMETFGEIWSKGATSALAIVFDEVDYITPASPTSPHWRTDFNIFWRELRGVIQESQRRGVLVSLMVSGVSSKYFRATEIEGIENSALHIVPDEYLAPFARDASLSMLAELGRRCGLNFTRDARDSIAAVCADMPFWMRMAGSFFHRSIDADSRPQQLDRGTVDQLMTQFSRSDGLELAKVALTHLERVYPEVLALLRECDSRGSLPIPEARLLLRYGLAGQVGGAARVTSDIVRSALGALAELPKAERAGPEVPTATLALATDELADELAVINRRRVALEIALRQLVKYTLRLQLPRGQSWVEAVLSSVAEPRRVKLRAFTAAGIMDQLYWLELGAVISSHWKHFASMLGDKSRFLAAIDLVNDRPDAHSRRIDLADVALYRRELTWLEERVNA